MYLIADVVADYLDHVRSTNHSPVTLECYERLLRRMEAHIESSGTRHIEEVRGHMVEQFMRGMANLATTSRNYYITVLQLFFGYAVRMGYIERDPSAVLQKARVIVDDDADMEDFDDAAYSDRQIMAIVRKCKGKNAARDRAVVALLSATGLRASELCSLNVGDWRNMRHNHVYVKRKGGAFRWVVVSAYANPFVDAYIAQRPDAAPEEPLFLNTQGERMSRQSLYKMLAKWQRKASVARGVHIFRHTYLTAVRRAAGMRTAQAVANHRSPSTTQGYIHSRFEERQAAANGVSWASAMAREPAES